VAFLTSAKDLCKLHDESKQEALVWQKGYPEYQRLADNELISDLDEALPEVNDGTLAASLYKLPKRVVSTDLTGRAKATDRDDAWVTELANIEWETNIIPNANSQAPFHRKWKDAVRKAAIYGSVPLITLFVERGKYTGADFIVAQPQDVLLEPGKVSDYDSDFFFWEVYYSKKQLEDLLERANEEKKEQPTDGYNKWNTKGLKKLIDEFQEEDKLQVNDNNSDKPKQKGAKFTIVFQRGVEAPFFMIHTGTKTTVREWSNPDPSGDVPVHFLYCYQDFENPYGTGIVKLAGGTQNVLDYMRQSDVLATQLGFRPPVSISGDLTGLDRDSIVYAQDAQWEIGRATVKREEISNQIYSQLPNRIAMYKTSINQLIPTGDTSISADAGDPQYSKTPAGVKFQQQSLSIDDEDFKDNLYLTYEAKARSMINTHFANMQGNDLRKLNDDHRDVLAKSGLEFPVDEEGNPTNELNVIWDEARAEFTFEIDAEQDKAKDEEQRLNGLLQVARLRVGDPMFDQRLMVSGKKIDDGELFASIIQLTTDNDKILIDVSPEDQQAQKEEQLIAEQEAMIQGQEQPVEEAPFEQPIEEPQVSEEDEVEQYVAALMEQYEIDEPEARAMVAAEAQGFSPEEIMAALSRRQGAVDVQG
jgi:hypothetical protein